MHLTETDTVSVIFADNVGVIKVPTSHFDKTIKETFDVGEEGYGNVKHHVGEIITAPDQIIVIDRRAGFVYSELCLTKLANTLHEIINELYKDKNIVIYPTILANSVNETAKFEYDMMFNKNNLISFAY